MSKTFKTIKPISSKQNLWSTMDIPVGTILQQIPDTKNLLHPIKGIVVEYNNQNIGIPYEYLIPNYEYKTTILLFHGFNSLISKDTAFLSFEGSIDRILISCDKIFDRKFNIIK